MKRYNHCLITVNKDLVKRHVQFKYGTIAKYCAYAHITTMRYWEIVNRPHVSKEVECLKKLAKDLNLNVEDILN